MVVYRAKNGRIVSMSQYLWTWLYIYIYIYIYIYMYILVSPRSEYTPYIFVNISLFCQCILTKVSIYYVATIIFQHCLNPLGHRVHQSFTGCTWSPLPLLHDYITELVDVKDLAHLQLPFEDAPQLTFTLSFFNKAVVVLEVCLGSLSC